MCAFEETFDAVIRLINVGPVGIVLPTTEETLNRTADIAKASSVFVVGTAKHIAHRVQEIRIYSPSDCLGELSKISLANMPPVIIFTDQLVDPVTAPILARRKGELWFYSSLEAVLAIKYRYPLRIWQGKGLLHVDDANEAAAILGTLASYYDSCDDLANDWLMRQHQVSRQYRRRVTDAQMRLQLYESVALNSMLEKGMDQSSCLSELKKIMEKRAFINKLASATCA